MKLALNQYEIKGPGNNLSFLQDLYRHPRFEEGSITTKFIPEEYPEGFSGVNLKESERWEMKCAALNMYIVNQEVEKDINGQLPSEYQAGESKMIELPTGDTFVVYQSAGDIIPTIVCTTSASNDTKTIDLIRNHLMHEMGRLFVGIDGNFGEMANVRVARINESMTESVFAEGGLLIFPEDDSDTYYVLNEVSWNRGEPLFSAKVNGETVHMKMFENQSDGYQLIHHGATHKTVCCVHGRQSL